MQDDYRSPREVADDITFDEWVAASAAAEGNRMPFDLNALERGYGEVDAEYNGHSITLRYRADLNSRALDAMHRTVVGDEIAGGGGRFPNVRATIAEVVNVLLPLDHDFGPGWDLTQGGVPVPITIDAMLDLPPTLPGAMLGAIVRDLQDPNRRRPSRRGSSPGADSQPTPSPTTGNSSPMPNGQGSLPGPLQDATIPPAGLAGAIGYAR